MADVTGVPALYREMHAYTRPTRRAPPENPVLRLARHQAAIREAQADDLADARTLATTDGCRWINPVRYD